MKTRSPSTSLVHPGLILFAAFCLLLVGAFIFLHWITPSDGARLGRDLSVFTPQGAVLTHYTNRPGLLQNGDILVSVNGRSIADRASAFFKPAKPQADQQIGQNAVYSLLRDGALINLEVPLARLPWQAILSEHWGALLFFLFSQALAAFVYWQRRSDPAAQAFFIWAFSGCHTYTWAFYLQTSDLIGGTGFWLYHAAATGLWLIFWAAGVHMLLVFPRQILKPENLRPRLLGLYLSPFLLFAGYIGVAWLYSESILTWWNSWFTGQFVVAALSIVAMIGLMIRQYATARTMIEKRKIRLVVFGGVISTGLGLVLYFLPGLLLDRPLLSPNGLGLINFPFIIAIAVAIWRYHLFDIDIIIRKTLVYSLLTGVLSAIYFGSVIVLQNLLTGGHGGAGIPSSPPSPGVIVVTTLLIAALFSPLRRRIQDFIDRRFFRRKYDVEQALADFATAARSQTDLKTLSGDLLRLVQETMQPQQVGLWLKPTPTQSLSQLIRKEG